MKRMRGVLAALVACWVLGVGAASAQVTTATIEGTVTDSTGGVVPGVSVTVRNVDTGIARDVLTDAAGRYRAMSLPLGRYEITAQLEGFQTETRSGITLTIGREAVVDFRLQVGQLSDRVTVTGEAALIETSQSALGGVIEQKQIEDLPLNARGFEQLALLDPAVSMHQSSERGNLTIAGAGITMSISGTRPEQNAFLLDGTDIKDMFGKGTGGAAGGTLGVDTVREFKVLTNAYSAEYGRAAGGVVQAVTRSGTNALHGTGFWFFRNSALDARNFFDARGKPGFERHQYGVTAGGPVRKNRTFFFGSYEGLRSQLTLTQYVDVPNADAHRGLIPVNRVPTNVGVSPITRPYLDLYPLPNGPDNGNGTGQYITQNPSPTRESYETVRVDHSFTPSSSVFGRYTRDYSSTRLNDPLMGGGVYNQQAVERDYVTIGHTQILGGRTVNEFRFGLSHSRIADDYQSPAVPSSLFFVPGAPSFGQLAVSGMQSLGNSSIGPRDQTQNLYEFGDILSVSTGKHNWKFGGNVKKVHYDASILSRYYGALTFNNLGDFLANRPFQFEYLVLGTVNEPRHYRQWLFGAFLQDDWQVTPALSLSAGVRYEPSSVPTELNGELSTIRDPLHDKAATVGDPLFLNPSLKNFGPRVGFAWVPFSSGKMSVRGGFGVFYDQISPPHYTVSITQTPPFKIRVQARNPTFPMPTSQFYVVPPPGPTITAQAERYDRDQPYVSQWNVNLQRELLPSMVLTLGYAGSASRHMARIANVNIAQSTTLPDGRKYFPVGAPLANPNFGFIGLRQTDATGNYHALVSQVQKRFSQGFQFQSSYTFSKTIDQGSGTIGSGDGGGTVTMDPFDPARDQAPSIFHVPHKFDFGGSWELPIGRGLSGVVGVLAKGWQVSGLVTMTAGRRESVEIGWQRSRNQNTVIAGGSSVGRPDLAPGASNNPVTGDINRWWDPASFAPQMEGTYGNLGKNTLTGPGLVQVDAGLLKNAGLGGDRRLQFRAEFFNLFNRANFATPAGTLWLTNSTNLNPAFGRIRSTITPARQIQLAVKLIF